MIVEPEIGDFHVIYNEKNWSVVQTCDFDNIKKFKFRIVAEFFAKKYAKKNNVVLFLHRKDNRIVEIINYNKELTLG